MTDALSAEDREALAEVLLASWQAQGMLHPPFDSDRADALTDADAVLASDWLARHRAVAADAARAELVARVLALADDADACNGGWLTARALRALVAPDHAETDRGQG